MYLLSSQCQYYRTPVYHTMDNPVLHLLCIHYTSISPQDKEHLFSLLSDTEKHSYNALQSDSKKDEFLVSRCALKALAKLAGFDTLNYNNTTRTASHNNRNFYISLSHTHDAVAVSLFHTPHGIDIEQCARHVAYRNAIIQRYFAPSEQRYINHLPWGKNRRFLQLWTLKEAIAKSQELSLTHALAYDTIKNPHKLLLLHFKTGKYICGIAIGDSLFEKFVIRKYSMTHNDLIGFLCGCGRYRIRTSDLLHVRQAL